MQWPLDQDLKDDLSEELSMRIDDFNPGETAMVLWALVRLRLRPTSQALVRHLEVISGGSNSDGLDGAVKEEEGLSPRTVSTLLWSLSQMNKDDLFISSSLPLVRSGNDPRMMGGRKMWGLKIRSLIHRLLTRSSSTPPPPSPLREISIRHALHAMKPRDTALSLHSLSLLKVLPPQPWLVKAAEALAGATPELPRQI